MAGLATTIALAAGLVGVIAHGEAGKLYWDDAVIGRNLEVLGCKYGCGLMAAGLKHEGIIDADKYEAREDSYPAHRDASARNAVSWEDQAFPSIRWLPRKNDRPFRLLSLFRDNGCGNLCAEFVSLVSDVHAGEQEARLDVYIVPYRVRSETIQILRAYRGARRWPESF